MNQYSDSERAALLSAISARHSVRRYEEMPLPTDVVEALQAEIDRANSESGLNIQLVLDEPKAFKGLLSYGKFSGVTNYLVMAGPKSDKFDELVGYYGERLVLLAQILGLNSCWAGLTYRKVNGTYSLADGEKIACYIALGYGMTKGSDHKRKSIEALSNVSDATPEWFKRGVEAAALAPTAVNQQKFHFDYMGDDLVKATPGFSLVGYTNIDLGIAKLHFEIGADHSFRWA